MKTKKIWKFIFTFLLILTSTSCNENTQYDFTHDNNLSSNNNVKIEDEEKDSDKDDETENIKESINKEITNYDITAKLKDNKLTLMFLKPEAVQRYYIGDNNLEELKVNTEYEVNIPEKMYKDVFILNMGFEFYPYVILVDEEGKLDVINIVYGNISTEFNSVPIKGIKDVVNIREGIEEYKEEESDEIYNMPALIATTNKNEDICIREAINDAEAILPNKIKIGKKLESELVEHSLEQGSFESYNRIEFQENKIMECKSILPDVGVELSYSGSYICIGADEVEEIYKYCLSLYYEDQDMLNMFLIEIDNSAKEIKMRGFKGIDLFDTGYEYITFENQ